MGLDTLSASLLGNMLAGKGVVRCGDAVIRAGEEELRIGQDFLCRLMLQLTLGVYSGNNLPKI